MKKTNKIQTPFSIEAWKNGAIVETRGGRPVRILCTDVKCQNGYPIVAVIEEEEYEHVHVFTEQGHYNIGCDDEFDLVIVEEVEEPERWAEDEDARGQGWTINDSWQARIVFHSDIALNNANSYDLFATEKQAKSALAMARISQLMAHDERYGGVVTDKEWKDRDMGKSIIHRDGDKIECFISSSSYHFLAFHTDEQRGLFLRENMQLIKDYLMID